ncbi:restriction endonuclease [uncultured Brevibacterium sp.]|uniref:restriction endonuclease n=1 Tax=uncultured Brevibacterium sp. TaxID=189678 RepID=UPI0025FED49C|nr:restriction endonuclease [uncultured Brevibacterium sp.]
MTSTAWVIRSGRYGERDEWALENSCSGGGWREVPDLTSAGSREEIQRVVDEVYAQESDGARTNAVSQLWALRGRIAVGDLLAMPMKTTREIAIGRVTSPYTYLAENEPAYRHVVGVEWIRQVPRSALKQDLLYTLGSALTIFSPSRNNAAARLEHVLQTGEDVGSQSLASSPASTPVARPSAPGAPDVVDEPESQPDIDMIARDQISSRIAEEFSGHSFAHLVAELLRAEGFDTDEAPPGADGGIDITAGRGLLGLESPKLIVQVKTPQIGSEVVAQLNGLVHTHGADYGLLATWSGLSKPARDAVKHQRFRVKVWDSTDIVEAVLRNYEKLPEDITERLPLRRVWMLKDA